MSVAMYPGTTPFTWTLSLLHSLLSAFVSCPSAPFAAAYAGTVSPPYNPAHTHGESAVRGICTGGGRTWYVSRLQKLMILPRRRGTMCWPAAWQRSQQALRFTFRTYGVSGTHRNTQRNVRKCACMRDLSKEMLSWACVPEGERRSATARQGGGAGASSHRRDDHRTRCTSGVGCAAHIEAAHVPGEAETICHRRKDRLSDRDRGASIARGEGTRGSGAAAGWVAASAIAVRCGETRGGKRKG